MTALQSVPPSKAHDAISRRAADFFQRRRFWDWGAADQAELEAWLAESVLHRAAYLRVEGIAAHTEELAALRPAKHGAGARLLGIAVAKRWLAIPLLVAASLALFAAYGMSFLSELMQPPIRAYSTDVGGRTLLKFGDGTEAELDTDTVARFRMSNRERTVWLEKGDAWFHVAHDPGNPFTVIVGKDRVTDLGTEFLVRRGADRVEVALLEGRAALSRAGAATAVLRPGDDAVATQAAMSVTRKSPQEMADALAWRRGMLVFRQAKLADVVREVNRYNATKFVIADPSIESIRISADLRTDDSEGFLQFAEAVLDLRADREGGVVLISRGAAKAKRTRAVNAR